MSRAVDAIILIRLNARAGQWVGVAELSGHMQMDSAVVAGRLEVLAQSAGVLVQRVNGLILCAAVPARTPPPPRNLAEAATEWSCDE